MGKETIQASMNENKVRKALLWLHSCLSTQTPIRIQGQEERYYRVANNQVAKKHLSVLFQVNFTVIKKDRYHCFSPFSEIKQKKELIFFSLQSSQETDIKTIFSFYRL